jgi:hypothetical protein
MSGQRRKALSEPITFAITSSTGNVKRAIDVRGASKFCVYPSTSTGLYSLVSSLASDLDSTAHSGFLGSTIAYAAMASGTTISVAANFYLLELATTSTSDITASAVVHTVP